jgi:hypothetical protein
MQRAITPDATGRLVACMATGTTATDREELLLLVRLGVKIRAQHNGKKPEFLACYLADLAKRINGPLTFESLLLELRYQARVREVQGEAASPIEGVDLAFDLLTYHHPRRGRLQMPFGTLRNHLTRVKKDLGR